MLNMDKGGQFHTSGITPDSRLVLRLAEPLTGHANVLHFVILVFTLQK